MPVIVGDAIRARLDEIEGELEELESALGPLREERKTLQKVLRDLEHVSNSGVTVAAKVDNERILEVVRDAGASVTSQDVARALGVESRNVARKLRKLVDDGELLGDPERGYSVITRRSG